MIAAKKKKFITDESGKRTGVLLDLKTFEQIEEELDELACIRAYDAAKPNVDKAMRRGDVVSIDEYISSRKLSPKKK